MAALAQAPVGERVDASKLKGFVQEILVKLGFDREDAQLTADVIVEADLRGVESHGVRAFYSRAMEMREGKIKAGVKPRLVKESGAVALFDGGHGYGPFLCARILEKAADLAASHGIGLVSIKNSSHWGCPAYYSRALARCGFIGIGMTNTNPAMPLWGSKAKSIGNNPLTIAVPMRHQEPMVLDMAMQQVAWGRLALAKEQGMRLPGLWGYDEEGRPTDDPSEILRSGRVRPAGDYKGSGLAVMLEVLTGVLSTGLVCYQIGERTAAGEPAHYSQTFIAIKIDNFAPADDYYEKVEFLYKTAKNAPLAEGFSEIRLPGDRSNATYRERLQYGIPVAPLRGVVERLADLFQLPLPWSR